MRKAFTLTLSQESALESLHYYKCMSASDFDRAPLEQLVNKGLATKGHNGHAVSYSITPAGETIYKSR